MKNQAGADSMLLSGVIFAFLLWMSRFSGGSKVQMERVVAIVESIQGGGYPNCQSLAEDLEVSAKTIQRDITFIRDRLCYPVEYDEKCYGYYFTSEVDGLSEFDIQVEDLAALFLAKQTMGALRGTKLAEAMRPSFERMSQQLEGKVSLSGADLTEVFSVKDSGSVEADLTVFGKLAEAVLKTKVVTFKYRTLSGEATRTLYPHHVGEVNGGWYVVGFDVDREAARTFALQRMSELKVGKETFVKKGDMTMDDPFAGGVGVWSGDGDYLVQVEVSGWLTRLVQERVWHPSQKVTMLENEGHALLEMRVTSLEDMLALVLSWGSKAKVLEPKKLLKMVRAEVRNMQH